MYVPTMLVLRCHTGRLGVYIGTYTRVSILGTEKATCSGNRIAINSHTCRLLLGPNDSACAAPSKGD